MAEGKEKVEARNVSMYPAQWALVDALAKDKVMNVSEALRTIVREWVDMNLKQLGLPLG